MSYELTNDEKKIIVNQHLKNLEYSIYNTSLSIETETNCVAPNANIIAELNEDLSVLQQKKQALVAKLAELE